MTKEVVVKNQRGLHASISAKIVQIASKYSSDIFMYHGKNKIDIKSILGLMSLAVTAGERVTIETIGDDAAEALDAITEIVGQTE